MFPSKVTLAWGHMAWKPSEISQQERVVLQKGHQQRWVGHLTNVTITECHAKEPEQNDMNSSVKTV